MSKSTDFFDNPEDIRHRIYEALRAFYVDKLPGPEAAKKFGFTYASFRNLCHEFEKNPEKYLSTELFNY